MSSEPSTSVSKGIFAYQGKTRLLIEDKYIKSTHILDNDKDCKDRMVLFKEVSLKIQEEADGIQCEINAQVFHDLLSYLSDARRNFAISDKMIGNFLKRRKILSEIPAAALVMGVSMPDHEGMFANLVSMIKKDVTSHIVSLKSIKCLNIKFIVNETINQLTGSNEYMDLNEENENSDVTAAKRKSLPTMKLVVDWYKSLYKHSPSGNTNLVEFVCLAPKTPTKRSCNTEFKTPERADVQALTPRKLLVKLNRISLISPSKGDQLATPTKGNGMTFPSKGDQSTTPTKGNGMTSPSKGDLTPKKTNRTSSPSKVFTPVNSPLASPTRRLTKMSLRSPSQSGSTNDVEGKNDAIGPKVSKIDYQVSPTCETPKKNYVEQVAISNQSVKYKPIIIIFEDFESFPPNVIQDYITILSHHQENIPVILIFGIATMVSSIHRLLPHSVSSLLSIHKFQSMPASSHLSKLLDKILMNWDHPFKLDSKVFNFLIDSFLFNDFSVHNFVRSFKLSMMNHFQSNPASMLCVDADQLSHQFDKLSLKKLDAVRCLRSFRRYVESQQPEEQIKLLEDPSFTKKTMMGMMMNLHLYHNNFFPIFRCLHTLTSSIPHYPLGKTLRELYSMCLQSPVCNSSGYDQSMLLVRTLSKMELLANLSRLMKILKDGKYLSDELNKVYLKLEHFLFQLEDSHLMGEMDADHCNDNNNNNNNNGPLDTMLQQKLDMTTLKQILRDNENKKKKISQDVQLRQEIVDYLDEIFRKYLKSPKNCVLFEALYFRDIDFLRSRVLPTPRSSLQRALATPHHYLQNEDLQMSSGQITPDLPDICIAYKLHLECGKLINLYDWLQAFVMILEAGEDEEDDEENSNKNSIDMTKQARFVRAIAELQFLGFIKPTRRKTDHVARLTWGAC